MGSDLSWRARLVADLNAQLEANTYGVRTLPLTPNRLLDVELVLTLLSAYFPNEDPTLGWTVLTGLPYPALDRLPPGGQRAVALARRQIAHVFGLYPWQEALAHYRSLPTPFPLYRLDGDNGRTIVEQPDPLLPNRRAILHRVLATPPPSAQRTPRWAEAGHHRFTIRHESHEVEIPQRIADLRRAAPPLALSGGKPVREPIRLSLSTLVDTAAWMDEHAQPDSAGAGQSWATRMRRVQIGVVEASGLAVSDEMVLDGLLHLVGMLGSGKSTLFTVLAVWLARAGYRVTLVQSDVASLLRELEVFEALRGADPQLLAVPFIGQTTRTEHLNRLHLAQALTTGNGVPALGKAHPGFAMLSTVCPLDGLRRDAAQPIPPSEEPCTALRPLTEAGNEQTARDCPILPVCPVHLPTRLLEKARIWLATPASLLASGPQQALLGERARTVELVMRHADVVLVDEADLVQTQFDERFAPHEMLVGRPDSLLDRIENQVSRQVYRPGRLLIGRDPGMDRWLGAHHTTQQAADFLFRWLRESATSRRWLKEGYFSAERLLSRVRAECGREGLILDAYDAACATFERLPRTGTLDPTNPAQLWQVALFAALTTGEAAGPRTHLAYWLISTCGADASVPATRLEQLADHLLLALVVGALDQSLAEMIWDWAAADERLELDRGTGGLFYRPADALIRMVPETPMGAITGLQYQDHDDNGNGDLTFFQLHGIGRSLLYHLHDGLQRTHGIAGPHVILTSGTSWAPGSFRYHLHQPPGAVLLPEKPSEGMCIACFYTPLDHPDRPGKYLQVSGLEKDEEKLYALRSMVAELTKDRGFRPSMLDRELASLPEDRRRILLVTGSYDQASVVADTLASLRDDQDRTDVLALARDRAGEPVWRRPAGTLLRSQLRELPARGAQFLVAPLQAIERGHNIVVGDQAAIGSVYFLVRPMLVPDFHTSVQQINAWALRMLPNLAELSATEAGRLLRDRARQEWDRALVRRFTWRVVREDEALVWTLLVPVWQCIGRLLRGGVGARAHFLDVAWAPRTAIGEPDTEDTSLLVQFASVLNRACADPDPARRAVAELLYGAAQAAFADIKGLIKGASRG